MTRSLLATLAGAALACTPPLQADDAVNAAYLTTQRIAVPGVMASAQRVRDSTGEHILVLSHGPASDPYPLYAAYFTHSQHNWKQECIVRDGVASTQLDGAEASGLLRGASALSKLLADAATQQSALVSKDASQVQVDFITQIDPEQKGKFEGAVGGHEALKATPGARDLDSAAPVEKFGQPVVLMEAPASINWATPASTVLFAGGQLQWTTQSDMHMAAAFTVASVSANATGLFTHAGGIQAIAANGPVSLQAHTDQLEILADKAITVISVNDVIEIKAKEKIVLQAGQSSVTLEGGNITFACRGNFTVKGGQHIFDSAGRHTANLRSLPGALTTDTNWIALHYLEPETALGISGAEYEIHFDGGQVINGKLDEQGKAHHDNVERKKVKKVIYKPREPEKEKPAPQLEDLSNA